MKQMSTGFGLAVLGACFITNTAFSDISFSWATIGDAGNTANNTGYGSVSYEYRISKYEVTNLQYVAFLNAKARNDTHNLYNAGMASIYGGITRNGSSGAYTYNTVSGREYSPVVYVSFNDSMRFVNWLNNGQGEGDSESGAYDISSGGAFPTRTANANYAVTNENEWVKAACYKAGGLNSGYWSYGTGTESIEPAQANYFVGGNGNTRQVGSYASNQYGVFDMVGNVWEWHEGIYADQYRGLKGGSFTVHGAMLLGASRDDYAAPDGRSNDFGFRIVSLVPAPNMLSYLIFAGSGAWSRRRKLI